MLPANVRLDWKVIARYKQSSLFGLIISNEGKKFYNIDTRLEVAESINSLAYHMVVLFTIVKNIVQEAYSHHFIFLVTYDWVQ